MFKKVKCNHCEKRYDEAFKECPHCHAANESLDPSFKHIQMLPFGKQLALFGTGLFGFTLLGLFVSYIFSLFDTSKISNVALNMMLNAIVYGLLFIILFAIVNVDFKKLFNSFKSWKPFVAGICCFVAMLLLNLIYSLILQAAGVKITGNDNQQVIDITSNKFPLTAMVIFGFIGPICEELTYRVGLFSFSKRISKWVAYPLTMIVFALIHFNFDAKNLTNELINLPYYFIAGFALTFTYDNFGFAGSTIAHVLNNVFSLLPMAVFFGVIK